MQLCRFSKPMDKCNMVGLVKYISFYAGDRHLYHIEMKTGFINGSIQGKTNSKPIENGINMNLLCSES